MAWCAADWYKAIYHGFKNRLMDQWSRMESPEIDPYIYDQLIFDKNTKAVHCRKQ